MPTLSFEGETQAEIVAKVKRWLASLDGEERLLSPAEAVQASAELTKEALRLVASSAPEPVARSELVKGLTSMGYSVTDATTKAMLDSLDGLAQVTGESVVKRVQRGRRQGVLRDEQPDGQADPEEPSRQQVAAQSAAHGPVDTGCVEPAATWRSSTTSSTVRA